MSFNSDTIATDMCKCDWVFFIFGRCCWFLLSAIVFFLRMFFAFIFVVVCLSVFLLHSVRFVCVVIRFRFCSVFYDLYTHILQKFGVNCASISGRLVRRGLSRTMLRENNDTRMCRFLYFVCIGRILVERSSAGLSNRIIPIVFNIWGICCVCRLVRIGQSHAFIHAFFWLPSGHVDHIKHICVNELSWYCSLSKVWFSRFHFSLRKLYVCSCALLLLLFYASMHLNAQPSHSFSMDTTLCFVLFAQFEVEREFKRPHRHCVSKP